MKFLRIFIFLCLLILPLTLIIPIIIDILHLTFYIFPATENLNYIETLTDSIRNGKSLIEDFSYDSEKLLFKYILKKSEYKYPNVFIIFWLDNKKSFIDLSRYTYITLRIKEATHQDVTLYIKTFEPGISTLEHAEAEALRHNTKTFSLSPSINSYKINLSDFVTPGWWYDKFCKGKITLKDETYKKVVSFDLHFVHFRNTPVNEDMESLVIEEIAFHRPLNISSYIIGVFLILYYIFFFFVTLRFMRKKNNTLQGMNRLSFINRRENELKRIIAYIQHNYNDPEISTIKLQEKIGISSLRIFNLIKEEYHLSFKQLINKIRIQESKRLLRESDLRVVEISSIIGFNDNSYFNKVFKQIEGITPTEYREGK